MKGNIYVYLIQQLIYRSYQCPLMFRELN